MKILIIADVHIPSLDIIDKISSINKTYFDSIVLLGDVSELLLMNLQEDFKNVKPIFGVIGNHDDFGLLERYNIQNIHNKIITIDGIKFAGIMGSFKYKNSNFPSLDQDQSIDIANSLEYADVLITHTSPYGIHEKNYDSHLGLLGINQFITKNRPVYNLHGHQHINKVTKLKNDTTVMGFYGVSILNLLTGEIKNIYKGGS